MAAGDVFVSVAFSAEDTLAALPMGCVIFFFEKFVIIHYEKLLPEAVVIVPPSAPVMVTQVVGGSSEACLFFTVASTFFILDIVFFVGALELSDVDLISAARRTKERGISSYSSRANSSFDNESLQLDFCLKKK